jgi:type I restriction enzyme S subunit
MREQEMKKKDGFKETKLGWIPEEWEVKKISEIGKVITGGTPSTSVGEYWGNEHLWYTPTDISNFSKYAGFSKRTISSFGLKKSSATLFPKGTLMVCTRATIGEIAIATSESCTNQGFKNLIVNEKNELEFIYYLLIYSKKRLIRLSSGSTFLELGTNDFREVGLFTPKLPEQKAIANCLSTWDTAITKQDALIKEKKQLKKALMQQLLTGKKRLSGFSGEWEELQFSDITERVMRKNSEGDDTVVTISAKRGFVLQEDFFNKRVASDTLLNYTLVHKGEFCYNKSYSKGYPMGAFKRLDAFDKAVVTTLYICFSLKGNVDSDFMDQYFKGGKMIANLMRIAQEGGRAHGLLNISLPDFFSLTVKLPMLEEQTAIAKVLKTADQEIKLLTNQRNQLQLQKKGLMQQLLTGKKRLKV